MENKINKLLEQNQQIIKQNFIIIQLLSQIETSFKKKKRKPKKEQSIIGEENDN